MTHFSGAATGGRAQDSPGLNVKGVEPVLLEERKGAALPANPGSTHSSGQSRFSASAKKPPCQQGGPCPGPII